MEIGVEGRPESAPKPPKDIVGMDLAPERRPGVPRNKVPRPMPNAQFPPQPMTAKASVPRHGRPNKQLPPVYGTAVPPKGLSGAMRRLAYRYPDHVARHWTMLLLADRVDLWEYRLRKMGIPVVGVAVAGAVALATKPRWLAKAATGAFAVARLRASASR